MPNIIRIGGGGGNKHSTLPPPVSSLLLEWGNTELTVSFAALSEDYYNYLHDEAYHVVLKEGSIPQSPTDGTVIILNKNGEVI